MSENTTAINFKGLEDFTILTLEIDYKNMNFITKNSISKSCHIYFEDRDYIGIRIYGRDGILKNEFKTTGNGNTIEMANGLNGLSYENGDMLIFYHAESSSRLFISGIENPPFALENGCKDLGLEHSYFYILNGKLKYTNKKLDNPDNFVDKTGLINLIEEVLKLSPLTYTLDSYLGLKEAIKRGRNLLDATVITEEDINYAMEGIEEAKRNLKVKNIIKFKNRLGRDSFNISFGDKTIIATGLTEELVSPGAGSRTYIYVEIYDRKGIKKLEANIRGNENPLKLINLLNGFRYENGDYFKFYHEDKMIEIKGFVKNTSLNLETDMNKLDLENSFFYIEDNLKYENVQLNISADTTVLKNMLNEIKKNKYGVSSSFTSRTYEPFQQSINAAEALLKEFSIKEKELLITINDLETKKRDLATRNEIIFMGYNNRVSLILRVDFTNMSIVTSNSTSRAINDYYPTTKYLEVKIFDKNGIQRYSKTLLGSDSTIALANELHGFKIEKGDYLKFYHAEPKRRLAITEIVENMPFDLSGGFRELDLENTYIFLMDEKEELRYSNKVLGVEEYKEILLKEILKITNIVSNNYELESYRNFQRELSQSRILLNQEKITIDQLSLQLQKLRISLKSLKEKSKVILKGRNDDNILTLEIDDVNKKFLAIGIDSNSTSSLKNKKYIEVMLYDRNNIEKASYSIGENDPTLILAKKLNQMNYEEGDYLKFYHVEFDRKFMIDGYVDNSPFSLNKPSSKLNLYRTKFIIENGILRYSEETNN